MFSCDFIDSCTLRKIQEFLTHISINSIKLLRKPFRLFFINMHGETLFWSNLRQKISQTQPFYKKFNLF